MEYALQFIMLEWLILGMIIFGFTFGLVNFVWLCKIQKQLDNAPPARSEAPSRR